MSFKFPELPYSYDALEPHIDARTMELHYSKHHQGYFKKFMAAVEGTDNANKSIEEIFTNISKESNGLRNNGGGYYNHTVFWNSMAPNGGGNPSGKLADAINAKWGNFDKFKEEFANAAATRFGSGWAWLIVDDSGNLAITSTANQDNNLMNTESVHGRPILGLDVWEHAYYLNYQNRRPDYIAAFFSVANWDYAAGQFDKFSA